MAALALLVLAATIGEVPVAAGLPAADALRQETTTKSAAGTGSALVPGGSTAAPA